MNIQILSNGNEISLFVEMKNEPEEVYAFLKIAQKYGIIQKYFWVSIFDEGHVEYIEPMIFDAFKFICHVMTDRENAQNIVEEFKISRTLVKSLPKFSLSEKEMKEWANKLCGFLNVETCC